MPKPIPNPFEPWEDITPSERRVCSHGRLEHRCTVPMCQEATVLRAKAAWNAAQQPLPLTEHLDQLASRETFRHIKRLGAKL